MTMAIPNSQRLLGLITDDDLAALQARNKQRAAAAITRMGSSWCCHALHSPQRARPVQLRRVSDWPALHCQMWRQEPERPIPLPPALQRIIRGA